MLSRKISLLTRAGSLEPEVDFTTESPAPKRRTVRFAGLDSPSPTLPTGRRPKVSLLSCLPYFGEQSCLKKDSLPFIVSRWRQAGLQPRFSAGLRHQAGQVWWRRWTGPNNNSTCNSRKRFLSSAETPPVSPRCLKEPSPPLQTHNELPTPLDPPVELNTNMIERIFPG